MTEIIGAGKKKSQKTPELHNLWGFLFGVVVCSIISIIIYFTIIGGYKLGAIFITIGYFGFGGIADIPIGFKGVPLFLNRRISFFVLPEGFNWILPRPLMSFEKVDMKEQMSDPGEEIVLTGKGKNTARVTIDSAIQWKIYNPYKVLSVGLNVIEKGMNNLIKEVNRSTIAKKTPDEAIKIHETLKNELEKKADEKSKDWGIDILNVFITKLELSKEVIEAYEEEIREEREKIAEEKELQHLVNQIELLKKTGIDAESAKQFIQTDRKRAKVTKTIEEKIYKGLEGTGAMGAIADKFLSNKKEGK